MQPPRRTLEDLLEGRDLTESQAGDLLGQLRRPREQLLCYGLVHKRYGRERDPEFRIFVAMALVNIGTALGQLGRAANGIRVYDKVVQRYGGESATEDAIFPAVEAWVGAATDPEERRGRQRRARRAVGTRRAPWNEELVLERYELFWEIGLVAESRAPGPMLLGERMAFDHRRILATALGRIFIFVLENIAEIANLASGTVAHIICAIRLLKYIKAGTE